MRVYRSDAGWQESEKDIRADAAIVSMSPTKLSLGMVASLAEPAAVSPYKIIVPRIVIGGVILDQPAGGGIGAVSVGSPCGHGGHGQSRRPGSEKNALDPARSRSRSATSTALSRADYEDHISFIETFHEGLPCLCPHQLLRIGSPTMASASFGRAPQPASSTTPGVSTNRIGSIGQ